VACAALSVLVLDMSAGGLLFEFLSAASMIGGGRSIDLETCRQSLHRRRLEKRVRRRILSRDPGAETREHAREMGVGERGALAKSGDRDLR
jgi:hypothetical protein